MILQGPRISAPEEWNGNSMVLFQCCNCTDTGHSMAQYLDGIRSVERESLVNIVSFGYLICRNVSCFHDRYTPSTRVQNIHAYNGSKVRTMQTSTTNVNSR